MARERQTVSERVIQQVANASGTGALDLPSLWDAIEPDALDAVVDGMADGEITFAYAGYDVTVTSEETIDLRERPAGDHSTDAAVSEC